MENDLKSKLHKVSSEEKRIIAMRRKLNWWTAGVVLFILVVIGGLFSLVYFPGALQKGLNLNITFGNTAPASDNKNAYIGIEIRNLQKNSGTALNLAINSGVLISRVMNSSPADEAGLEAGDIITRYDRTMVTDTAQFQKLAAESDPGDRIRLVVDRDGRIRNFYLLLTERPVSNAQLTAGPPSSEDAASIDWGCTLSPLTASLIQKLSIPSDITGVVVVSVSSKGLAKSAGIEPGDVIVSVNQKPILSMLDFYEAIEGQKTIALKIFRNGSIILLQIEQNSAQPPLVTIAGSVPTAGTATAGMPTAGMPTAGMPTAGVISNPLPAIVAIAANGNNLYSQLASRFGPAPWFIIIDLKNGQYIPVQNTAFTASSGYGIIAAQIVASKGAKATIAGSYGIMAYNALIGLGISPFIANPGTVLDVFNQYKQASLSQYQYPSNFATIGGPPTDEVDDEEEVQDGYKAIPYTIPPQGKYDPALDPANAVQDSTSSQVQTTAGQTIVPATDSYLNLNQQNTSCLCPVCNITYDHPASVPCSSLVCTKCGSRLINTSSGSAVIVQPTALATSSALPQRVAIAANGYDIYSQLALRFGTAPWFIIIDLKTGQYIPVQNDAVADSRGYGIIAAQIVASKGAGATIAGSYGTQAYNALVGLGITPFIANPGRVLDVFNQYKQAGLSLSQNSNSLPGFEYSSNYATIGGPPTDEEDDEEEVQDGYKAMPYTIPPQGKYDPALDPANQLLTTAGTTQRAEYCLCPLCNILVPHVPGISCSDLACPQCGNRLMNADTGTPLGVSVAGPPDGMGQSSAGVTVAGPPDGMGQSSAGVSVAGPPDGMGQSSAGVSVAGPPDGMGQSSAGVTVAGPPDGMGQSSAGVTSTGLLVGTIDGICVCPSCGTTVPHVRGTACSAKLCPNCGAIMIGDNTSQNVAVAGTPTAGMPTAGAPTDVGQGVAGITVAGMPTAGMPTAGMPTAGMPTAGMPTAGMPTAGMPTAGMPTAGAPTDVGQGVAGTTVAGMPTAGVIVAGVPNVSTALTTAGMPTAGVTISGMPDTLPPVGLGLGTAGVLVAGVPNVSTALTAGAPTDVGQGVAGVTTIAGANSGKICIPTTGKTINSPVADLFDKAPYFLIVGFGSMDVVTNPNVQDLTGSGVQSAQLVVSEGADVVIANDIGIRAIEELHRLQVKVYTGVTGTANEALTWYQNNRLTPTTLNSTSDRVVDDAEEQHGPSTSVSKSKSKGDVKGEDSTTL